MGSFYKFDTRSRATQVIDSTGGTAWDSTSWPEADSTSTQSHVFKMYGQRHNIPFKSPWEPFDTDDYEQIGSLFQCPANSVAYVTDVYITYGAPSDSTNLYAGGDSTFGYHTAAKFRFFVTGMPLDTTSTVWAPTNWVEHVGADNINLPFIREHFVLDPPTPINRELRAGESLDLRVLPHDGPSNYAYAMFKGYIETTV